MKLDVRRIESGRATELYIAATPDEGQTLGEQASEIFEAIEDVVKQEGARICRERIFSRECEQKILEEARRVAYSRNDALAAPDWLLAGAERGAGGVQVHAIKGGTNWKPLQNGTGVLGWMFDMDDHRWAVTSGLSSPVGNDTEQTLAVFEKGSSLLAQAGMDMSHIARTWIYMEDILDWYGPFNTARTNLFIERGLLAKGGKKWLVPASTGMGVRPGRGGRIALEIFAVKGDGICIDRHAAAGKQRSAFEYGSAFARSSMACSPAGKTCFISGTAAIDEAGNTCFLGDAAGQINMTMDCVSAVLRDHECGAKDVVQAIAYCKTPAVAEVFRKQWEKKLDWPWVVVIGDVCRDDLLFELEATAVVPTTKECPKEEHADQECSCVHSHA